MTTEEEKSQMIKSKFLRISQSETIKYNTFFLNNTLLSLKPETAVDIA